MRNLSLVLRLLFALAAGLVVTTAAKADWQSWKPIPNGLFKDGPSVVVVGPNKDVIVVTGRGLDDQMYWNVRTNGQWRGWQSLGGPITSSPSCVSWGGNRIDCFARDGGGGLTHIASTDAVHWSAWDPRDGKIIGAPSATSYAPVYLTVFARGLDGGLYSMGLEKTIWTNWQHIGGSMSTAPGCSAPTQNSESHDWMATCFANDQSGHLEQWYAIEPGPATGHWGCKPPYYHDCSNCLTCQPVFNSSTPGQAWAAATGLTQMSPSVTNFGDSHVDVFVTGLSDGRLWQHAWNALGGWKAWVMLDGALASSPSCAEPKTATQICIVRFGDNMFYEKNRTP